MCVSVSEIIRLKVRDFRPAVAFLRIVLFSDGNDTSIEVCDII